MSPRHSFAPAFLAALSSLLVAQATEAQVKPRIVIAFDTSGSMGLDLDGNNTFGDGVLTNCAARANGELCGGNCTAGIDTDCDGEVNDSRIAVAKEALRNMILAFGDVEFSLARFPMAQAADSNCPTIDDLECNNFIVSLGNPQCNTGTALPEATCAGGFNYETQIPTACRPDTGGRPGYRRFNAATGSPTVCINYGGGCEIDGRNGDFLVDFTDTGTFVGLENTSALLRWIDNEETAFNASTTTGNFCNHLGAGDCELRPTGATPLAGLMDTIRTRLTGTTIPSDAASACRPYSVILITDGQQSNFCAPNNPNTAAAALEAAGIDVFVIGLAVGGGAATQLNSIAASGGTTSAFFANSPDELSAGLADIVRRSLLIETCDNTDEDCDGLVDEGFPKFCSNPANPTNLNLCVEPTDVCDGVDSDCDGSIDEGTQNACGECGAVPSEVCDGVDNDCDDVIDEGGVCSGCVPTAEICDGMDNDCDTRTDEGVTRACGTNVGECTVGIETCTMGTFGSCSGVGPTPEVCDNRDNDCDGVRDGNTEACGISTGACNPGTRTCTNGSFGECVGDVGPADEICDGIDNDCDTRMDEGNPGGGLACGTDAGVCREGVTRCVGGMLVCQGETDGTDEVCDGLDNDCDGFTDEGNPGGGATCGDTEVGQCEFGREVCFEGAIVCRGATGPSAEICDGLDNDCDMMTDEGDPEGGAMCGDDTGECQPGITRCIAGELQCQGAIGPSPEICDGLDNNCNGVEDEGIGVGAPCGTDTGECTPGVNVCRDGALVCEGATLERDETCNGFDDDCDGVIDEGLPLGAACGVNEGLCMEGSLQCIDGVEVCVGEVGEAPEGCDCEDNDCDGTVDEDPDGTICPEGSACVECACSSPCRQSEFGFICPPGRAAFLPGGPGTDECFCVTPRCEDEACGLETIERDDETLCGPGDDSPDCACRNNACTFPCDGVVCEGGTVCRPDTGRCVEDNCRGLGCGMDEVCDVATGACETDPCAAVSCGDDEACRDGVCEGTCVGVECAAGEICRAGVCSADLCADVSCGASEVCDPLSGECAEDLCIGVRCPLGAVCDSLTGDCEGDPCEGLRCPDGLLCEAGECVEEMSTPDAGMQDAGVADADAGGNQQVLASGGGGCACDAAGSPRRSSRLGWLFGLALFGFITWRRRRRTPRRRNAPGKGRFRRGLAALALFLGGCEVDPFCLDCEDPVVDMGGDTIAPIDMRQAEAGSDMADAGMDADMGDGGEDSCLPAELCNDIDDDCDGEIDEEIDTQNDLNNCGGCGVLCAPAGAFGECREGACLIAECDVNARDLNGDPADGCEYRCLQTGDDDTLCDLRDNDCDGEVDEDVAFDTDPVNCGSCARVCRFARVESPSCTDGECIFDDDDCEEGFFNINGVAEDGCEYSCTLADPAVESCNGRDDDCDGMVDEGNPEGGGTCGTNEGLCETGVEVCEAGAIVCSGGVREATETCNGDDDDCDGMTDENNPDGGALCGESRGECAFGRETCVDGALECVGAVNSVPEICDGLDNDCDGTIDNGNPGGGAACGETEGACTAGMLTCSGGALSCVGGTGESIETCNGIDDDCDSNTDETFSFLTDINNCGGCGRVCDFTRGFAACIDGNCELVACETGFVDADGNDGNGCEYACDFAGTDICNGVDDDCDRRTDEGVTPPANFCNANGVCAGTAASCGGADGFECNYPSTFEEVETRCDGLDNDCDGRTDEAFPTLGDGCSNGQGACQRTGTIVCDGLTGTRCNAPPAGTGMAELCNNADDDCDGMTDENISASIPTVTVNRPSGGTVAVMQYEASRPDASSTDGGNVSGYACSNDNVLPWVNVTWAEARDACAAIGSGWALCAEDDWQAACEGPTATDCTWSYASACTSSSPLTCNGEEFDSTPGGADDDDVAPTGSFASCYTRYGAASTQRIYDLSGNVKEWTSTERGSSDIHAIRGGAFNNVEDGRACGFDFTVGDENFAFINTGFRCCRY